MIYRSEKQEELEAMDAHIKKVYVPMTETGFYILLWKSQQNLENIKVFIGVLAVTSCIVLYRFNLGYEL